MAGKDNLMQIAIDGPAGAGKSTVARLVAEQLGYVYLDTGAMYRAVTLKVLNSNIATDNAHAVEQLLKTCEIEVKNSAQGNEIWLDGLNVNDQIRGQAVSNAVSDVSNILSVRKFLVEKQRKIASTGGVVLDGRDIGTVVLPNAQLKIFLIASLAVRAQRRYLELVKKNEEISLEQLTEAIDRRDQKDAKNAFGPMKAADDAIVLDTDNLSISQVVDKIVELAKRNLPAR